MDRRLEPYRALVPFLGQALGPDYEVALHDLTGETGAVAALANGGVTGQSLGAPLCGMARRFVQDGLWRTREFVTGYQAESAAKGRLRASALFIRDGEALIGMLCIYFDAAKYSRMARELLALCPAFDCLDEYRARCFVPGHWVTVCAETETYAAKALAIDEEGRLVVQRENGRPQALRCGEVTTRPARTE